MSNKIGFWGVFALVTGAQIGSGAFLLPSSLALFGNYALIGWIISGIGALSIGFVFSALCARFPQTGGPHVYAMNVFGRTVGFFVGWTYWIISWVSTTALVIVCIGYLSPIIGSHNNYVYLILQLILLFAITLLNFKGVGLASAIELLLTILKFIPLIILPICSYYLFDKNNFIIDDTVNNLPVSQILGKVTLLTFWGFIGVESATTPAGSVENPIKTIPRAIILGTICAILLYYINTLSILGIIPGNILSSSRAPYADAAQVIFGGNWGMVVSIMTSIVCIGSLNAWILASGQILLGLSENNLMPKIFTRKNSTGAPALAIIFSVIGIVPLLIFTIKENFAGQVENIIDISVTSFLFIYLLCSIALLKLLIKQQKNNYILLIITLLSILICSFIIYQTPIKIILIASIFTLSGLPLYFLRRNQIIETKL